MGRFLTIAFSLCVALTLAPDVVADESRPRFPPDQTLSVPSLTLTDEQFLRGHLANGIPVTLTGQLRFPNWDQRLPVVVLLHGSDGHRSGSVVAWRQFLNNMGIATFRLDSFGARDLHQVEMDQSKLSLFAQIYDTYRTIDVLAANPRIDPSRIAVMGFSRGGFAAFYTSMTRFQDLYGPTGARIAAHLPFYPTCGIRLVGELDTSDAPIRAFHGDADDWNPVAPCRDYVARLRLAGRDIVMTEYAALHAFDNPFTPPGYIIRKAQTARSCQRREDDGAILNVETGKPFTYNDACVEHDPTVGYDKLSTAAAQAAVKAFLSALFRLN